MTASPPVVFMIYNRAAHTQRVFAAIREARPARLLVIADGPKDEADRARVEAARATIAVDWPCEVERLYADANMGCGLRVSSGLDWAFARAPEAIVLEDDCLPDPSFFGFCAELLARHRDDERVMMIAGFNPLETWRADEADYFMAGYGFIWGWAGWRRSWAHYDFRMRWWPEQRGRIEAQLDDPEQFAFWARIFDAIHDGWLPSWDLQWMATLWLRDGVAATPSRNLVRNIGSGALGTFMTRSAPLLDAIGVHAVKSPAVASSDLARDRAFDARAFSLMNGTPLPDVILTLADRLAARGGAIRALALVRAGLSRHPDDPTLRAAFAALCALVGRPDLAR